MENTLYRAMQSLVAELEPRFPYAAALLSGRSGVQITDTGSEQQANEVSPSRGIVFTVYDGRSFVEYCHQHTDLRRARPRSARLGGRATPTFWWPRDERRGLRHAGG